MNLNKEADNDTNSLRNEERDIIESKPATKLDEINK